MPQPDGLRSTNAGRAKAFPTVKKRSSLFANVGKRVRCLTLGPFPRRAGHFCPRFERQAARAMRMAATLGRLDKTIHASRPPRTHKHEARQPLAVNDHVGIGLAL
jgi:hypothetical protein